MQKEPKNDRSAASQEILALKQSVRYNEQMLEKRKEQLATAHKETRKIKAEISEVQSDLQNLQSKHDVISSIYSSTNKAIEDLSKINKSVSKVEQVTHHDIAIKNTSLTDAINGGVSIFAFVHHTKHLTHDMWSLLKDYFGAGKEVSKQLSTEYSAKKGSANSAADTLRLFKNNIQSSVSQTLNKPETVNMFLKLAARTGVQIALSMYMVQSAYKLKKAGEDYLDRSIAWIGSFKKQ